MKDTRICNIFKTFLVLLLFIFFTESKYLYAESYVKIPSLKYSTKAVTSMDLNILIEDENIKSKYIQASVFKKITKTSRQFALKQKRSEVFEKVLKVTCNDETEDLKNKKYYACIEGNKKASVKRLIQCNTPKQSDKYSQVQYMCSRGKRAFDVYRIKNICTGTIPTSTTISRDIKNEKPNWSLDGEGAELNIKKNGAHIDANKGVYFLTPMQLSKFYKNKSFSDLIVTPLKHPAIEDSKIITYKLSISGSLGMLEKQSLGKRVRKVADGYCNGGAFQLAKTFSLSLANDLKWALSDRKVEYNYNWQAIDLRSSSVDYFNNSIKKANTISFNIIDISTGENIKTNIKISNLENTLFDYNFFKDTYLKGVFEDFIINNFDIFRDNIFFKYSKLKDKIKSGDFIHFQPNISTSLNINVEKRGYKPLNQVIEINPTISNVRITLVPSKDNLFSDTQVSTVVVN